MSRNSEIHTIHENYDHGGCYYQLLGDVSVNCKRFSVKETIRRHTGVQWLNIENWVDEFEGEKEKEMENIKANCRGCEKESDFVRPIQYHQWARQDAYGIYSLCSK